MIVLLLRKIEAYGFKSFAEKTEIALGPGVTAIVGPNGSGKSNISDAIRWALGEQSLKSLRGAKSEDVIFAGSQGRRALGIAEVSLFFDNSDGLLPLDFNEVVVTRRIFRSGDSEYYINKSSCRLKDIHELFADTGIGRDSMMVIGQNKIDEILNAKPEERRLLFEEAAGITKYKQRKRDALRKIEETESNLIRLLDITTEINGQLAPLAESAEKTKEYNKLHEEWLSYQVSQLVRRFRAACQIAEGAKTDRMTFGEEETVFSTKLLLAETEREKATSLLASTDESYRGAVQTLQQTELSLNSLEASVGVLIERQQQGEREWDRLETDKVTLRERLQETREKHQEIESAFAAKETEQTDGKAKLAQLEQEHEAVRQAAASLEIEIESGKEKIFDVMQDLVHQRNHCRDLEKELATLVQQQEAGTRQLEEENRLLTERETTARQEAVQIDALAMEQSTLFTLEKKLLDQKGYAEQEVARLEQEEIKLQRKLNDSLARQKALVHLQEDFEGFGRGIKSVLKSNASWRAAVHGAVAQLIHVPADYVTAIEISLGGAAQHLITETAETAKAAIAYLKEQRLGRVTFLPLDTVQSPSRRDMEVNAAKEPGVLGFASDLVTFDSRYQAAIMQVLGRTLIVETIDQALAVAKKYRHMLRVVTLDGELLSPGGSMTGGSLARKENSFIGRQSEIETISKRIAGEQQVLVVHQETMTAARQKRQQGIEALAQCRVQLQTIEVSQAELKIHSEQSQQEVRRLALSVKTLTEQLRLSKVQAQKSTAELLVSQDKVRLIEQEDEQVKEKIAELQFLSKEQQESVDHYAETVTAIKVELSAIEQNLHALEDSRIFYKSLLTEAKEQSENLAREQHSLMERRQAIESELVTSAAKKQNLTAEKKVTEELIRSLYEQKMTVLANLQTLEKDAKELRKRLQDIQGRLHERELLIAKYEAEGISCTEQLESQFHLSVAEAEVYYIEMPVDELLGRITQLEKEIAKLGPIHAGAIEEYAKLSERYEFLQQQYEDLISGKNYLVSIVQEIDQTMAAQFKESFEQINNYFHDIFIRLFGGGQAELVLQSPQELLETGIEIIVQPPGKKQQYLSLFSGGERSLTVIALLFSFLSYRPAPFCMVDEIDAALDEANVTRFSEFLKDYAKNTQFIVVTHRKGTMEIADVMHGITMEESGVSKLISVKFSEKAG